MTKSFDTGEIWQIVFSTIEFAIFLTLIRIFGNAMIKRIRAKKEL